MLTDQILPQEFLPYVLDNLKLAMGRERNFMSEVLGVIHQIKSSLHDELPMAYEVNARLPLSERSLTVL